MLPPKVVGCAALLTPGVNARAARAGASSSRRRDQRRIAHLSCPWQPKMQLRAGELEVPPPAGRPAQNNTGACQTAVTGGFGGAWRGELAPLALRHCTPHFSARGLCSSTLDNRRPTPCSSVLWCCKAVNTSAGHTAVASGFGGARRGELAPLALCHCAPHFGARGLCSSTLDSSRPTPCSSDLPFCGAVNSAA
jgi:hypothetical protein